jgi:hypothetical protein
MVLTFKKDGARIIREHFENLTPDQFRKNLEKWCPEVLEEYEVKNTKPTEGENGNGKVEKAG